TALWHADLDPGRLDRLADLVRPDGLDGGDRLAPHGGERRQARPHRLAVEVDGAGAAERHAAPELGAGEPQLVPQRPQQGCVRGEVEIVALAVDGDRDHRASPLAPRARRELEGRLARLENARPPPGVNAG